MAGPGGSFKFVYVPCDEREVQELSLDIPAGQEVECLTKHLQAHFRNTSPALDAGQKANMREELMKQVQGANPDAAAGMLDSLTGLQLVEAVPLLPGGPATGFIHVNLYVDDRGRLKGLPRNHRASAIAAACGMATDVSGDAFIARVMDNEEDFTRLDFTAGELSADAPWVTTARQLHAKRGTSAGMEQLRSMLPGANIISPGSVAINPGRERPGDDGDDGVPESMTSSAAQGYTWTQSQRDITLEVVVPAGTKAKDVDYKLLPDKLRLAVATLPSGRASVVEGLLFSAVDMDDSSWEIDTAPGGQRIVRVLLRKKKAMRWLDLTRPS